jgi:hypothetical protein
MSSSRRVLPTVLGAVTLASLAPLIVWDASPGLFPARAHDVLAAVPLTMVAMAYLVYQGMRRVAPVEFVKAILSALAFVFWALNQLLTDHPHATLFNDIAVAAFVLDVVLVIVGWPPTGEAAGARVEERSAAETNPRPLPKRSLSAGGGPPTGAQGSPPLAR